MFLTLSNIFEKPEIINLKIMIIPMHGALKDHILIRLIDCEGDSKAMKYEPFSVQIFGICMHQMEMQK